MERPVNARGLSPHEAHNIANTIQKHDLKENSETKGYPGEITFGNPWAKRVDYQYRYPQN